MSSSAADSRSSGLFVIAAPSGGGKTSLVNALLSADPGLALSVSHSTRPARPGEVDGQHYHFTRPEDFERMAREGAFLEHAIVFGHAYGTHAGALQQQLDEGFDVILEIDWQGAAQVRAAFPEACSIFILPPSLAVLRERLSRRGQDSAEVIEGRMREAQAEISHWREFDYLVVNEDFEHALGDLRAIIRARRLGREPQAKRYTDLLAELLGNG
ncbi:MAG: guanylate kinase [Xanthomonadales bacterium]|nr:guanylate kinase [Xanthomonadales bacterium]